MKVQFAVMAAIVGLCSNVAFAASEGGDTWSAVQALAPAPAPHAAVATDGKEKFSFPIAASEGGDTWSEVQPGRQGESGPSLMAVQ
jgi:hypothetical protein